MAIDGVNNQQQVQQPTAVPSEEQVQEVIDEVAPLLNEESNLNIEETRAPDKNTRTHNLEDVPELEEADLELLRQCIVDLEALLAYLQAEQDEAQLQVAKNRIQALQGQLKAAHENSMKKVNESIEAIKDQESSDMLNRILGWVGVALAVAMAVVAVLSCGTAAAICACVCAGLAVAMQVMNETGAMDKLVEGLAEFVQECAVAFTGGEVSNSEAEAIAQMIIAAIELAIAIACMVCTFGSSGAGVLGTKLSEAARQVIQIVGIIVGTAFSVAGVAAGVTSGFANYRSTLAQADVTEMQGLLKKLRTRLEQEDEELQLLIQKLMNSLSAVIDLLMSKQDTISKIAMNIGA